MKFEFKLQPGEPTTKEPPRRLNPFDLLKTRPASKEVVSGFPVFTDAFGRTLYENSNGQFRAIGEEFDLVANVSQLQNNLITLAPQPDDEEEDTGKGKTFKKLGGGLIVEPEFYSKFPFVYLGYSSGVINIYKTDLSTLETEEIFTKPNEETSDWWHLSNWILGFHDNTAVILGYNENWEEKIYQIGFNHNVVRAVPLEGHDSWFSSGKFTYYNNTFYYAAYKFGDEYSTEIFSFDKNLVFQKVAEFPVRLENIKLWKNFIAYRQDYNFYIYDYINEKPIAVIPIEEDININMVDFSNLHACFVVSYSGYSGKQYQDYHLKKAYFILLKPDGEYKVWEEYGINGWMASDGEKTYVMYHPHYIYTVEAIVRKCFWVHNGKLHSTSASGDIIERQEDGKWKTIYRMGTNTAVTVRLKLADGKILFGTTYGQGGYPPVGTGGNLYRYTHSTNIEYQGGSSETIKLENDVSINQLIESGGTILAATTKYRPPRTGALFVSNDGESWQKISGAPWNSDDGAKILWFKNNLVFATRQSDGSLWKSTSSGHTWNELEPVGVSYVWNPETEEEERIETSLSYFESLVDIGTALLGISGGELYSSSDGGEIWNSKEAGIAFTNMVLCEGVLYFVSTEGNLYLSHDYGDTFESMQVILDEMATYQPQPGTEIKEVWRDGELYMLTTGHVFTVSGSKLYSQNTVNPYLDYTIKIYENGSFAGTDTIEMLNPEINGIQGEPQLGNSVAKVYKGDFWINNAAYRYSNGTLFDGIKGMSGILWIGDYIFYAGYEDDYSDVYGLWAVNIKTLAKTLLMENLEPTFTIEHLVNYYLR